MPLKPGDTAPDFTLRNTEKNKVTLLEHRGHSVLLLFFPLAFTSTCTKELCMTRDNLATYTGLNTKILGISVDSLFSLKRYKEDQQINFTLLSDFNKTVSAAYGSLYDHFFNDMDGVSKRSAFVIDKDGVIQYAEVLENASEIPDFEAIVACLQRINS